MDQPAEVANAMREQLLRSGIDVVHLLALSWYNSSIPDELGARIPVRGTAGQSALCVLVGNSRAVWEAFLEGLAGSQQLQQADNPLELYLEQCVFASLVVAAPGLQHRVYWSHRRAADLESPSVGGSASEHVALQRMAHHSGLAFLDHNSHLCLHPRFGPWFSLRCAIIFDDVPYMPPKPAELPNPLPAVTRQYVRMALHSAVHNTSRKFHVPEVDVEAAEAVLAEASIEAVLEGGSEEEEEEEQQQQHSVAAAGPCSRPSSSACSLAGSEPPCTSGGSTPCASSGCSSPRAGLAMAAPPATGPWQLVDTAARRLAAAQVLAVPRTAASQDPAGSRPGTASCPPGVSPGASPPEGSAGIAMCRRRSSEREGKPSMRAVAANWHAWVAVRDSPCPGHPMRYSEEQIQYHYSRDRQVLVRALMRRDLPLCPSTPTLPASGLLDPALQSFHHATRDAQKNVVRRNYPAATANAAPPITAA